MADLIDKLREAPQLLPDPDADLEEGETEAKQTRARPGSRGGLRGRPGKLPAAGGRQPAQSTARQPFAEPPPAAPRAPAGPPAMSFTQEQADQLKVLWDDFLQRQRTQTGPKTMSYRCIGFKPDGAVCGAVVEAGMHEERVRSGEIIRCPHGPDAPEEGVRFDRERYPKYHYELTPMEPIW